MSEFVAAVALALFRLSVIAMLLTTEEISYNWRNATTLSTSPRPSPHVIVGGDQRMADSKSIRPSYRDLLSLSQFQRFWAYVANRNLPNACWEWTGAKHEDGYGCFGFYIAGQTYTAKAHRIAWELMQDRIPDGLVIDHLCRNRACVNLGTLRWSR